MSLRINTNVAALNAYNNLHANQVRQEGAFSQLSSGLRINKAADDAAGLSIAQGLTSQINGMKQAVANTQDGINVAQIADGALGTVQDILQRMRGLIVKAGNEGTQDVDSLKAIREEIVKLNEGLDRIADQTKFGKTNLLDGTFNKAFQVGADGGDIIRLDLLSAFSGLDDIPGAAGVMGAALGAKLGDHSMSLGISKDAAGNDIGTGLNLVNFGAPGATMYDVDGNEITTNPSGAVAINPADLASTLESFFGVTNPSVTQDSGNPDLWHVTGDGGVSGTITFDSATNTYTVGGLASTGTITNQANGGYEITVNGSVVAQAVQDDPDAPLPTAFQLDGAAAGDGLGIADALANHFGAIAGDLANWTWNAGTGTGTFEDGTAATTYTVNKIGDTYTLSDTGGVIGTIQDGPNGYTISDTASGDTIFTYSVAAAPTAAGVGNGYTSEAAAADLAAIDAAINQVSGARSGLGAVQNQLSYTVTNLQTAITNVTASRSNLTDADLAEQVTEMTQSQILTQAATSVLAQANSAPQAILQLLQ